MSKLTLARLTKAVHEDAALRRVRRLQPVGGAGDKIFPPTYPGDGRGKPPPRHVFERRRVDGKDTLCVLVDSVASQANRLEESLRGVRDAGKVKFPVVAVDFAKTELADIGRITTLDAPHRVFDAIIRDSEAKGKKFRETPEGQSLVQAKPSHARAVYELSPTALVFGAWNSTGEGGGLGAKFPRAIVSEIVGFGVAEEPSAERADRLVPSGKRVGSRIDPLGIRAGVKVYKRDGEWTTEAPAKPSKEVKELRPSEVNHSNIAPTVESLGVTCDYLQHTLVISCAALRRLRFAEGGEGGDVSNAAAHAVLAALGLVAVLAQDAAGYFLRSRCDLVPDAKSPSSFQVVHADGTTEDFEMDLDGACALLSEAIDAASKRKVTWRADDVVLTPQKKLLDLVRQSRERALQGDDEAADADER
jgi:CRISPR-associated protein Csb1